MILCSFPSLLFLLLALAHSIASPVNLASRYSANSLDLDNSNATHDLRRRINFDNPRLIMGYLAVPQVSVLLSYDFITARVNIRIYRPQLRSTMRMASRLFRSEVHTNRLGMMGHISMPPPYQITSCLGNDCFGEP
ncbi:hypothetical protein F5890DRAFT_926879 [Lentinula detonsa]|uniref:Uncharacterized protein n=1 Tax=Lentinula detonsa TaxID=2804962 RepID=A0AA38Q3Q1_9AGAR|nr:hypothetical protein F5890DRAFT_926879 [Lentinula detonsa]